MPWSKQLSQLRDAMAIVVPFKNDVLPILTDAGIQWTNITLEVAPNTLWHNILTYADQNGQIDDLVNVLTEKFPKNPHIKAYKEQIEYDLGKDMKDDWVEGLDPATIEKITGEESTLLPIRFLEMGIQKARSVARILIPKGSKTEAGSGFLLDNNLLLTNNHVISNTAVADLATVQFNYEEALSGLPIQPTEFKLNASKGFATSVSEDWTAVRIEGDANKDFGVITLKPVGIKKGDFVNIIQHPGGKFKQIGLYHNLVTFCNERIVQYLTDTEPGSSGSPVFNSDWDVVALHHSGGMLREPGTTQKLLRNEGININAVITGLKASTII